jgi:hypothetical protein
LARVFLSYSSQDRDFVRELHRRLTRDGVACFYDQESIAWGANFVVTLEKAIDECEFLIPVLSPAFLQSQWAERERTAATHKLRPLLLCECDVPAFLRTTQTIDVSTSALFEANYPRICKAIGGTLTPDPEPPTDRRSLPPVTPLRGPHRMPFRSVGDQFVGRVDALWTVFAQLSQGKTSIVQGVGVVYGTGGPRRQPRSLVWGTPSKRRSFHSPEPFSYGLAGRVGEAVRSARPCRAVDVGVNRKRVPNLAPKHRVSRYFKRLRANVPQRLLEGTIGRSGHQAALSRPAGAGLSKGFDVERRSALD